MFFSSPQSVESSTKEKRQNAIFEMLFMPQTYSFAAHKDATLLFLVWPWTVMNPASTQGSPSSLKVAPRFASPGLFCQMKSMLTPHVDAGALWDCLLTSRLSGLVMRDVFQAATSFLLLKHD